MKRTTSQTTHDGERESGLNEATGSRNGPKKRCGRSEAEGKDQRMKQRKREISEVESREEGLTVGQFKQTFQDLSREKWREGKRVRDREEAVETIHW